MEPMRCQFACSRFRRAPKALGYLLPEILDGRNASLGTGVEQPLGRPASSFGAYATATALRGVWS